MINNFAIFKVAEKKNDKAPDYRITINVGTKEQPQYEEVGGGWIKEGQKGKFISCTLSKAYGERKGYEIVESHELDADKVMPNFDKDSKGRVITDKKVVESEDIPF